MLLLIHNNDQSLLSQLTDLAASNDYRARFYLSHIDVSYSLPVEEFLEQLSVNVKDLPVVLELRKVGKF